MSTLAVGGEEEVGEGDRVGDNPISSIPIREDDNSVISKQYPLFSRPPAGRGKSTSTRT